MTLLTKKIFRNIRPVLSKFTSVLILAAVVVGLVVFQSRTNFQGHILSQIHSSGFSAVGKQRFNKFTNNEPKLTKWKENNSQATGKAVQSPSPTSIRRVVGITNIVINKLASKNKKTTTTTKVTPIGTSVTSNTKNTKPSVTPTRIVKHTATIAHSVRTSSHANVKKKTYVCKQNSAGLGNKIYMFAASYGTARRKNMALVMKNDATLRATFNIEGAYNTNWTLCKNATTISEPSCCRAWPNIYNVSNEKTVILGGYLQSYKYFDDHRDEVRRYLIFRNNVLNEANNKLNDLFKKRYPGQNKEKRTLIGVHIRRGDYLSSNSIKFGYVTAPKEYIFRAQKYMETQYSNITYFVCSNDLAWTNDVFKGQTDAIIVPIGPAHVDLALLSLMDHMIMTVGTYGFWASWFVNGTTIYLREFAKPGSVYSKLFDKDHFDTIPASWIGL
ncbi:galactoside alpha-(1,2)-fucosyltransferase 2-like [Patella vulgata]|uniref:galactoside alpha-(1,2)-fucosyltransferase 2-like n=1 Tax=Patella vulgata TaxID=6465 RepID=UPI0024A9F8CA|nr:galactoside alpha-(1,2)-fucosyltransferase 2-like [Patella vulgata]